MEKTVILGIISPEDTLSPNRTYFRIRYLIQVSGGQEGTDGTEQERNPSQTLVPVASKHPSG